MSKDFSAAVRRSFVAEMKRRAPHFHPEKVPTAFAWPGSGERAFLWQPSSTCYLISVVPNPKGYDSFFVEVGWSRLGRFPAIESRPSIPGHIKVTNEASTPEFICNLSSISSAPGFWEVARSNPNQATMTEYLASLVPMSKTQAESAAAQLVASAMMPITSEAIPFFEALEADFKV
jgi:hypothetical protein